MVLSWYRAHCPDELRADFQEHYGLNIDEMGRSYTVMHAAALAAQLPRRSRCMVFVDPKCAYTAADFLLESIEYHVHVGWWMQSKDAKHGRNKPRRVGLAERAGKARADNPNAMDVNEYAAFLALPRTEVEHGD